MSLGTTTMLPTAVLAGLESAVNLVLAMDPETVDKLIPLEGRVLAVRLLGTGITLYLIPRRGGLHISDRFDGIVDTTLEGAPFSLLRMKQVEGTSGLFGEGISIEGDVALGQKFRDILAGLDIDWEEHLSRISGDVVAHQAGNLFRDLLAYGDRLASNLREDTGDYLREELRTVVSREEVDAFTAEVDTLRDDAERLAARIDRLFTR